MPSRNYDNSNFNTIANATASGNITGITTGTLAVAATTILPPIGNITITGGSNGQVLRTNGSGALSWVTVTGGPAFAAYRSGGATGIGTTGYETVGFDTKEYDTGNYYNTATSRYTPQVAGYYQIMAQVTYGGGNTAFPGGLLVELFKNGAAYKRGNQINNTSVPIGIGIYVMQVNATVYLNGTTDYVTIASLSTNNTNYQYLASNSAPLPTRFEGYWIRA